MAAQSTAANGNLPSDARTIQWAPNAPTVSGGKPGQGSIGACDACRARKVRCLASENTMSNKCQRCARAGRECVYTVHSKTRRRKRTDTRVKELEEKVKSLSVLLEQGKQGREAAAAASSKTHLPTPELEGMEEEDEDESEEDEDEDEYDDDDDIANTLPSVEPPKPTSPPQRKSTANSKKSPESRPKTGRTASGSLDRFSSKAASSTGDVIERGIVSLREATELFDRYVNVLMPNYPSVVFPKGTKASEVREKRPILFLACIAAAASTADPKVNLKLNQEILHVYATKVALEGQKNLDLVQSILISSLWYYPPERFDQLKFHQYIHMAATMALDLGLGKRVRTRRLHQQPKPAVIQDYEPNKLVGDNAMSAPAKPAPDSSKIESRRTMLACYLQCASVSLSLRLPNSLRFTSYMAECLEVLENSPEAAPTDKRFTAWVRIQRIIEECVNAFALDDPESTVTLEDPRIQSLMKGFESQMQEFRKQVQPQVMNPFLEVNYHVNNIFVHEIGLHPDHEPEDFRPPFYVAAQLVSNIPTNHNPAYVDAIMECVSSAQTILNIFINMPVETIRALPALIYVRTIYSCIVLIKLEISTRAPGSELVNVLNWENLNVPTYLQRILTHLVDVVGKEGRNIISAKFLMIFKRLFEWYRTYRSQSDNPQPQQPAPFEPSRSVNAAIQPPINNLVSQSQLTQLAQPSLMPDFNTLPQTTQPLAPFSTVPPSILQQQRQQQPPHPQQFSQVFTASPPRPHPQQPPQYDFHASLLTNNNNTTSPTQSADSPPADYNTTTYNDNSRSQHHLSPSTSSVASQHITPSPEMEYQKMEVDPNMFAQLQDLDRPFTFNPDPNDWLFDPQVMSMGGLVSPGMIGGFGQQQDPQQHPVSMAGMSMGMAWGSEGVGGAGAGGASGYTGV